MATLMRRTLMRTRAPGFGGFRRIVPPVGLARSVSASTEGTGAWRPSLRSTRFSSPGALPTIRCVASVRALRPTHGAWCASLTQAANRQVSPIAGSAAPGRSAPASVARRLPSKPATTARRSTRGNSKRARIQNVGIGDVLGFTARLCRRGPSGSSDQLGVSGGGRCSTCVSRSTGASAPQPPEPRGSNRDLTRFTTTKRNRRKSRSFVKIQIEFHEMLTLRHPVGFPAGQSANAHSRATVIMTADSRQGPVSFAA
ncbi:MAG: hypothetical protein KGL52_13835 [Rhodospirillales bacterium]|nr:hypothetical protein [Rhodospirillales bacterium]